MRNSVTKNKSLFLSLYLSFVCKGISAQEAVWGTELLQELEEIKHDVDPNGMFDCNNCIADGKRRAKVEGSVSGGKRFVAQMTHHTFIAVGVGFIFMM